MGNKIVDKFFTNQATPDETRRVLVWFETAEGKKYLQKRLNVDFDLMDYQELKELVPELDSELLYSAIHQSIIKKNNVFSLRRRDWIGYSIKAAAAVLVIIIASLFSVLQEQYDAEQKIAEQQPIIFETQGEENRNITLADGTEINLNENSKIIVPPDYLKGPREITLSGEAYFDVEHNSDQPFIIHANESDVEVLGTSFNVKSLSEQTNIQVAVVEGRVAFKNVNTTPENEALSVTLSKGQYGYMDIQKRTISVDDLPVENYIAWKSGQFVFEDLTLQQVCTQLNRLYEIECSYANEEIQNLLLTASFSNESMDKTLEVIALSLDIEYENNEESVYWSMPMQ